MKILLGKQLFRNTVKCGKRRSEGRFNVNEVNSSFFSV